MIENNTVQLLYGTDRVTLSLPSQTRHLQLQEPQRLISPDLFQQRLDEFLSDTPLDLANPILVLADKTRLCGYPFYLPPLIASLEQHGMDPARLKIVIGYGTHPRQSEKECLRSYGTAYKNYTFIHHDCQEKGGFIEVGRTSRGTPIRFRRDLLNASSIITMGAVSHHYFAGFGGGRKLIFPGCGEREAIYANHGLYLDSSTGAIAKGCGPGILRGNPLAEDLFEIEEKLPVDLAIHGILDSRGDLCNVILGGGTESFFQACKLHSAHCEVDAPCFDVVIASCGGYPKDINFIQSHKAIHNAATFVADGGLLLLYGECRDGVASKTFLPWFELGSFEAAFNRLSCNYEGNGGTALAMMTKSQRISIGMVTDMDEAICRLIGVEPWSHKQVTDYLGNLSREKTTACITNASLAVKKSRVA